MDITTILNRKGSVAISDPQLQAQIAQAAQLHSQSVPDMSEQSTSQAGEHPVLSYPPSTQAAYSMSHGPQGVPQVSHPDTGMQMMQNPYMQQVYQPQPQQAPQEQTVSRGRGTGEPAPRIFNCSTCNKGFARRSDLARHERIHSGIRPHACDWPGCGKQFIQRSALTVHSRVHTGEKPHMCERCGKPFSDSSSLARHRRIHSGKRPYKCPYANCQKTFTRRTTLTRHQNHHTGTLEEAAAQTEANLRQNKERAAARPQEGPVYSTTGSAQSTPSPAQPPSLSPASGELPPLNTIRPTGDYYLGNGSIPPHMRSDFPPQNSPRASPTATSPSLSSYGGGGGGAGTAAGHPRPSMTSHPATYGPPQPLEPPATTDQRPNSVTGSPHMSSMGWASPSHASIPSPGPSHDYGYPPAETAPGGSSGPTAAGGAYPPSAMPRHMYYANSTLRRPGSIEQDNYDMRSARNSGDWSTAV